MPPKEYMVIEHLLAGGKKELVYVGDFLGTEEIHKHISHDSNKGPSRVYRKTSFLIENDEAFIDQQGIYFEGPEFIDDGNRSESVFLSLDKRVLELLNETSNNIKLAERRKGFSEGYEGKPCRPTSPTYREGYNHGKDMAERAEKMKKFQL